jgi:hypothetical protein
MWRLVAHRLHHQGGKNERAKRLLVTANLVRSQMIVPTVMMEVILSSETLVL